MAQLVQTLVQASDGTHNFIGTLQQQRFYVLTMLQRLLPNLLLFEDAQKTTIPKNSGGFGASGTVSFRRFNSLWTPGVDDVGTVPTLEEGTTPSSKDLSISEVTTSLKQYGDWIKISDLSVDAAIDPVLVQAAQVLGEYEGRKLHRVILQALDATTNVFYGDGSVGAEVSITGSMKLTANVVRKIVRRMRSENVPPFPDGYYHGVVDPFQSFDLMEDPNWVDVAKYVGGNAPGGGPNMLMGELGRMHGVRFRECTDLLSGTGAGAAKVYHSLIYGPDGFGMLDLATQALGKVDPKTNRGISIHVEPPNRPDRSDPLGQWGFVSCKVAFAALVFDDKRVMKVLTAASD